MAERDEVASESPNNDDATAGRMVRYLIGDLSEQEVAALNAELRDDPAKRDLFVRLCLLESRLVEKFAPGRREFLADSVLDALGEMADSRTAGSISTPAVSFADVIAEVDEDLEPQAICSPVWTPAPPKPLPLWRRPRWLGAAAVLLVGLLGIVWLAVRPTPAPVVATVTGAIDVEWEGVTAGPAVGSNLVAGREFRVQQGLFRMRFESGADLVVEGPAVFTTDTAGQVTLTRGRLTAMVPPAAKGFVIRTGSAVVTDLGTEFGVDAGTSPGAPVEVHVFEGLVSLQPTPAGTAPPAQSVGAGTALRVAAAGTTTPVAPNPAAFVRTVEADARQRAAVGLKYDRWLAQRFAIARDPDVVAYYPLDDANAQDAPDRLLNRSPAGRSLDGTLTGDAGARPQWTTGRWPQKKAITFGGAGAPRIELPVSGDALAGNASGQPVSFTLALWVKSVSLPSPGAAVVSWGAPGAEQFGIGTESTFYRTWMRDPQTTPRPLTVINSQNFTSTEWHQVVSVYDATAGTVTLFVDGEKVNKQPDIATVGAQPIRSGPITLGSRPMSPGVYDLPMHGAFDELVLVRRAMTGAEVQQMYRAGRPE